jgi:predicted aspartyl protease
LIAGPGGVHDLAFVTATLTYAGVSIEIADVLVDTGAASTIINADLAADAGVHVSPTDVLRRLRGVGGHEHVFTRRVDRFAIGALVLPDGLSAAVSPRFVRSAR